MLEPLNVKQLLEVLGLTINNLISCKQQSREEDDVCDRAGGEMFHQQNYYFYQRSIIEGRLIYCLGVLLPLCFLIYILIFFFRVYGKDR